MKSRQDDIVVPATRTNFKKYLAINPNHFGNFPESGLEPVEKIITLTTYEELTCIGFNPNLNVLEATISIKLAAGYDGSLCSNGSREYVQFYIDYGDGAGFQSLGYTSVNVHDIPDANDCTKIPEKPLSYSVTLSFTPKREFCFTPLLPLVRGILSWEAPPLPGAFNWQPVWGNILDQHIQIPPRPFWLLDILNLIPEDIISKLPSQVKSASNLPIPLPDPPPMDLQALSIKYRKAVSPHRFGFPDLYAATLGSVSQQALLNIHTIWSKSKLNFPGALQQLQGISGNTMYEQLYCLGLEYSLESLVATFHIKLPSGYSGSLCQSGSTEYVAFWSDWNSNDCTLPNLGLSYLGTVQVNVHDIQDIPKDGISYSAILPVDFQSLLRSCESPHIARVRAVLSWSSPPSTTDPNWVPYWGNIIDAHVQIPPGVPNLGPTIEGIGGVYIGGIDTNPITGTGLTLSGAFFLSGVVSDTGCPFGSRIDIQGKAPPNPGNVSYRIRVLQVGNAGTGTIVTSPFNVVDIDTGLDTTRTPPLTGLLTGYLPYLVRESNWYETLAWWYTSGDGLWQVRLETLTTGVEQDGPWYRVLVKNSVPYVFIERTSPASCEDIVPGTLVKGDFTATDPYLGAWNLDLNPPGPGLSVPNGPVNTSNATNAEWSVDTTHLSICGYSVDLQAHDKTIVNSEPGAYNWSPVVNTVFCLRPATGKGLGWDNCEVMDE